MATRAEMIAQIRNTAPELLAGVDVNALEDSYITRMLQDANRLAYMDRSLAAQQKNPNQVYAFTNPADYFQAYGTIPVDFQGSSGYYDTKEKSQDIRYLTPDANATYALVSPKSGQVLGTGAGQQGLLDLATQANNLNYELGREADWQLQKVGPGGQTEVIGTNKYNSDRTLLGKIFGPILDVGLPILTSALIPGAGFLSTALQAAAGSAVASAANDRSLKDTLARAALTGVTAGIGDKLAAPAKAVGQTAGQTAAQTAGQVAGQTAGQAATQAAAQAADEIIVNAILPSLGSQIVGGAAGGLASSLVPSFFDNAQLADAAPTQAQSQPTTQQAAAPSLDEIVVTAGKSGFTLPSAAALGIGTGATAGLLGGGTTPTATPADKNLLQKITAGMNLTDYLTLASLAGSAAGGLFGGGGGGGVAATSPYTSLLGPAPTLGGAVNATTRQMNAPYAGDYETYGMGPEYQFFKPA